MSSIIKKSDKDISPAKSNKLRLISNFLNNKAIDNWVKSGKGLIYKEKEQAWKELIVSHKQNSIHGHGQLSTTFDFMKQIEQGENFEKIIKDIKKIENEEMRNKILTNILYFSNNGPDLFEAYYEKFPAKYQTQLYTDSALKIAKLPTISSIDSTKNIIERIRAYNYQCENNANLRKQEKEHNK